MGYFLPESLNRYLMSAAMIRMTTIQMAICMTVPGGLGFSS
jgi:hypothetical protein